MINPAKQNFISVDGSTAKNSYDEYFVVGEVVRHESWEAGEATILSFELNLEMNEVKVHTDKGYAHIDFLAKLISYEN